MFALAILASITLAAPDVESNTQFPVEAYAITGKVAATLLPAPLREVFDSALSDPHTYRQPATDGAEPPTASVESLVGNLTTAFSTGATDIINTAIARCVRMATSAALPGGDETVNQLIAAHHVRLAFEACVDPRRLSDSPDPDALWRKLSEGKSNPLAQVVQGEVDHNLALIETRLEFAALLCAKMIAKAWHASGEPILAPARPTIDSAAQSDNEHLASKNSKVFHQRGCPHLPRIKKANLIRFESFNKAKATGRKPCKTCKPTG